MFGPEEKSSLKKQRERQQVASKTFKTGFYLAFRSSLFSVQVALTSLKLLVNSSVDINMVSIEEKRQQRKKLRSQLSESDTDFMIGENNHETKLGDRINTADKNTTLNNANNLVKANSSEVDIQTLEKNIAIKVRGEEDNVITSVEARVQDAVLTVIENFLASRVTAKSAIASSGRSVISVVLDPDQRDFWGNIEGLRKTASSRLNPHTELNRIDETRASITREESNSSINERNIDRPTHIHRSHSQT